MYTVYSSLYTVHCTLNTVHCTLYTVHGEKPALNYLPMVEENMRLTGLWNMIGFPVIYIHFSISIHLVAIENVHIQATSGWAMMDWVNLLYRAVAAWGRPPHRLAKRWKSSLKLVFCNQILKKNKKKRELKLKYISF